MTHAPQREAYALDAASDLLCGVGRVAVLSHIDPDADAIGSLLGLAAGLRSAGKQVTAALTDPIPGYAHFLPGVHDIVTALPPEPFDAYVFADAAEIDRVGALYTDDPGRFEGVPIVDLDHHHTNPLFGTVNVVDGAASSTSELAYRLLCQMGVTIDRDAASALLFGIVGDTGSFQNGATTPGSLATAANLIRAGADPQAIAFQLFERKRFAAARLFGDILHTIELDPARRIVFAWLGQAMLEAAGASLHEVEGVTAYLRGIEEAEVIMLLKEQENGEIRVSLRSRPGIDVSAIASALGGGGHKQAAGATLQGPREQARRLLTETYDRFYGDHRNPAGR